MTLDIILAHSMIFSLYKGRIRDKSEQIDELAKENREYRVRFLDMLDQHYDYKDPNK